MIGRTIADNYRILSKLGAGSFGQVYLCEHIHTHEQWAIKIELNTPNSNPILAGEVNTIRMYFVCNEIILLISIKTIRYFKVV
jgi:serine/threonine protein kinase